MMDALKAEAQKIAKEIEEFTSRTAKEVATLVITIIPDICHEPHEHIRVKFFCPV